MALIKELPELERPREKLKLLGASRLSSAELLAILLGTGTRRESALTLANRILSMEYNGMCGLSECSAEELTQISGIGAAKSCQIVAAVELGRRIATKPKTRRVQIGAPADIAALFMEELRCQKQECFRALLLNIKNEIICKEEISSGNINSAIVDPGIVFRPAVKRGAAALVLVHNHPSGNPEPSAADLQITVRLQKAGELLGVKVLDHLILGDGSFVSLRQRQVI